MIWYLVDHVNVIYLLLGLAFLGVVLLFWQNKRGRELLAMAILIAIGFLVWFLASLVMTDRKQVEHNMHVLAGAARDGNAELITKHLAKDFQFQGMAKPQIGEFVTSQAKAARVTSYFISSFNVDKISRDKDQGLADVSFMLRVDHANGFEFISVQDGFCVREWAMAIAVDFVEQSGCEFGPTFD